MIKNIVFDFGGVIADISRNQAVQAFIELGLKDADARLDKYHQTGIFQELEEGKLSADAYREELGRLCGRELTEAETRRAWLGFFVGVDSRKLEYLLELRKNYRVYILSNTNPFVMSWARSPEFSQAGKPLDDYCEKLYLSYQIGYTKPARQIFDFMVEDSGILPAETMFVDDGAANVGIGKELGFQTFQPANGSDWRGELSALLSSLDS
nr:HAD family phosphatase [uncultured Bacteroides sp.]